MTIKFEIVVGLLIFTLTTGSALVGWMLNTLINQGKAIVFNSSGLEKLVAISSNIEKLLCEYHEEQREIRKDLDVLRYEHAALSGEHKKKHQE